MRLADRHRPIANLVISNVPGPDFPLYLAGAELVAGFPLGPVMDGMGVNITIMSYRGILYWGIMACPDTIPACGTSPPPCRGAGRTPLLAAGEARPTYRSVEAAAAVRASGIEVPTPRRAGRPGRRSRAVRGRGHGHRRGARAHREWPAEGLGPGS
jgi:diacylglycerol O-acyltransferase